MRIREAVADDLPAIVDAYNQAVEDGHATCDLSAVAPDQRTGWLADHAYPYALWVAETDDGVVGWASLHAYDEKPCFHRTGSTSTYVARRARGAGVGTALRLHLMAQARVRGFHTLVSRAWATNEASLTLWLRLGWQKVARLREVVEFERRLIDCYLIQVMLEEER